MNDIITQEPDVYRPSAAINPERLEYLWSLAERIGSSSLVPESLRTEGNSNNKTALTREQVIANVFAVCEQADRWNQSPFALLQCAAIVHGKLGFEGKVISAVLEANFGIVLHHYYTGDPRSEAYHLYLSDRPLPEDVVSQLKPGIRVPGYKIMDGSVSAWKTSGNGSPWKPDTYAKMLVYRGSREWARIYKPAAVMGVLADDELLEVRMERDAQRARDISPSLATRFGGPTSDGFSADNVTKQLQHTSTSMPMDRIETCKAETPDAVSGEIIDPPAKQTRRPSSNSSSQSSQGGDEKSSGGASTPSPRASAGIFEEFSSALLRFAGTGNGRDADITKAGNATDAFWNDKGGKPAAPADATLCRNIIGVHLRRMANEINAEATKAEVKGLIDKSFNAL